MKGQRTSKTQTRKYVKRLKAIPAGAEEAILRLLNSEKAALIIRHGDAIRVYNPMQNPSYTNEAELLSIVRTPIGKSLEGADKD